MKNIFAAIMSVTLLTFVSCGQTGGNAPNPTVTGNTPSSGGTTITCGSGGVAVNSVCWYYGAAGESCTTVCASRGGYNSATLTYVGSGGSAANCGAVMDALGVAGTGNATAQGCGLAIGCYYDTTTAPNRFLCTSPATNTGDSYGFGRRICACG